MWGGTTALSLILPLSIPEWLWAELSGHLSPCFPRPSWLCSQAVPLPYHTITFLYLSGFPLSMELSIPMKGNWKAGQLKLGFRAVLATQDSKDEGSNVHPLLGLPLLMIAAEQTGNVVVVVNTALSTETI